MIFWIGIIFLITTAFGIILWPFSRTLFSSKNFLILIGIVVFIPALSGLLYYFWGGYDRVQQAALVQSRMAEMGDDIKGKASREKLIHEFEAHLEQNPQSAKGWYLVGKLYLHDQRTEEAVKALQKSYKLNPVDVDTLLALAQALFIQHHNSLNPEAHALLLEVLKKAPESPVALTLLGTDAYNKHQYNQALSYFEKLLPYYSPESEDGAKLLEIIAQAQKVVKENAR